MGPDLFPCMHIAWRAHLLCQMGPPYKCVMPDAILCVVVWRRLCVFVLFRSCSSEIERASRPLVGFGVLIDNTIKGLTCLQEIMSRDLIQDVILNKVTHVLQANVYIPLVLLIYDKHN